MGNSVKILNNCTKSTIKIKWRKCKSLSISILFKIFPTQALKSLEEKCKMRKGKNGGNSYNDIWWSVIYDKKKYDDMHMGKEYRHHWRKKKRKFEQGNK